MAELDERAGSFVTACGYEGRCIETSRLIRRPDRKLALCFREWADAGARPQNEREFLSSGFKLEYISGNDSVAAQQKVSEFIRPSLSSGASVGFDISSMTRAWQGAIVRELWTMNPKGTSEVFFAYVPAKFKKPPVRSSPNEFVSPVQGFASLAVPDLPIAVVIGLGYERERALGLQQLLDPQITLLLVPKSGDRDPFFDEVLHSNRDIVARTPAESIFQYSLLEPASAFATVTSVVAGLREQYRVVLVSLGPKILGLLFFLLATRFPDVSVWRVSSGVHGKPRDAIADIDRAVVLRTVWVEDSD